MEQPNVAQPTNVARPKSRTGMWIGVTCGAVVLLAICCVLVGGIAVFSGAVDPNPVLSMLGLASKAQAASLAPAESPMFISADLDFRQAANFQKIWSIYQKSPQTQTSLDDLKKQFNTSTGCDFDADVAPWLGPDLAIFFTDASSLASSSGAFTTGKSNTANAVIAVATLDQAKATAAVQKCNKDKPTSEETYKGVKISNYKTESAAVTKNYLLIATTPNAMHAAIDASSGSSNLSQSNTFKNALAALPADRVATMYMDINALMSAVYAQSPASIQPQMLDQLKAYQGMAASLSFVDNGLRMDTAMALDSTKLPDCSKQLTQATNANKVLKAIPANAYVSISSMNLKGIWDCTLSQMDATSKKQMQDSLDSMKKQVGIDLNADILSWMTGEFALAITPGQPLSPGAPGVGVVMLVEAQDQNLINSKMDKLSVLAPLAGGKLADQQIKGNKMKVVTIGSGSSAISFGYGIVSNYFLLAGPMDVLNTAIDAPKNALADDATFKAVQAVLPARSTGYYYVNVTGLDKLIAGTMTGRDRTNYQQTAQPWLKPIKAIGLSGDASKPNLTTATMFVYISDQ